MACVDPISHSHVVVAPARYSAVDLTDEIVSLVDAAPVSNGFALAFCMHTTCSLVINEWEDGALEDFAVALARLFPPADYYAHDDLSRRTQNLLPDERKNGAAHVGQMVIGGTSQVLPIVDGHLVLGRWQRLFLWELDRPKPRTVLFQVWGSSSSTQSLVTNNQNARPA